MVNLGRHKGLISIGSADILGTGITAVFWFYLASVLGPEKYGEIFYFLGIAGIATSIALLATQNTITVFVAKKIKVQSALYLISIINGIVLSLVIMIIFYKVDVTFIVLAYVINTLAIGDLLGRSSFVSYTKYFLLQKFLTLILGISFYYIFGYEGIIFALALSYVGYMIRVIKGLRDSQVNFGLIISHGHFIRNNYILSITNISKSQVDKIIIPLFLSFTILGNYALALQVFSVLYILPNIIFKYILPQDSTGKSNKKLKKISIIFSIGIAIISSFTIPLVLPLIFPEYVVAVDAIRIMSFALVPAIISTVLSSELLAAEKSGPILIGKILVFFIIVVGMITLGTYYGIIGIAIAFLLANSIETIFLTFYRWKIMT